MINLKWMPKELEWPDDAYRLLLDYNIEKPPSQTINDIEENSSNFVIKFPVESTRCKFVRNYVTNDVLERNINSVYPIIHYKALELYCKFILHKRKYGTEIEKKLYKGMSLKNFIERLLKKRAVSFLGVYDKYLLLNNSKGSGKWETIGKSSENPPLVLEDCLSYDEIKCSVFLNASSYTYFMNLGDRKNMAKFSEDRRNIEGKQTQI